MAEILSGSNILALLPTLVDERIGLIRDVGEIRRDAGAPAFFTYYANACAAKEVGGQANFPRGAGSAASPDRAIAKAVGEVIERYCSAFFDIEDLPLCPARVAPFRCVGPNEFALYREDQYEEAGFPFVPFTEDTPVRWAKVTDLADNRPLFIPAIFVYLPYLDFCQS